MSCANQSIDAKADEHCCCDPAQGLIWNAGMDERDQRDNQSHRERMTDSNRWQGIPNRRPSLFLQPKRHRKEPAHARIDAMKGAQAKQRQPRPGVAHG